MALFCCLVAPPLPYTTPSTKTNDKKSQRSSLIWQFSNKECLLCQKRPKDSGGNISNVTYYYLYLYCLLFIVACFEINWSEFDETSHCPPFKKYQNVMINFHRRTRRCRSGQCRNDSRTCSIEIFDNEHAVDIYLQLQSKRIAIGCRIYYYCSPSVKKWHTRCDWLTMTIRLLHLLLLALVKQVHHCTGRARGRGRRRNWPVLENSCKNIMGLVMCTW